MKNKDFENELPIEENEVGKVINDESIDKEVIDYFNNNREEGE